MDQNNKIKIFVELAQKYLYHAQKAGEGSMRVHFMEQAEEALTQAVKLLSEK